MKKIFLILLLTLALAGCQKKDGDKENSEESAHTFHETMLKLDNQTLPSTSSNFEIEYKVTKNNSGTYRYTITISSPKAAMCSIKAMAIEDGMFGDSSTTSNMPQIGIDGREYNLFPNQVNEANHCYEKVELILNSTHNALQLTVAVDWKNREGNRNYREYLSTYLKYTDEVADE